MAWLRIDDGFAGHPKLAQLNDREFRVWVRVLCYCAKYRKSEVGPAALAEIPRLTRKALDRFVEVGLLDQQDGGSHLVHDWALYNAGTVDEKVRAYMRAHPGASANDAANAIPGRRQEVLDAVKRLRGDGS